MFYYFSSEYPSAIKVNGVYLGLIEQDNKKIVTENDQDFIEVCPLNCIDSAVSFLLNQDFLTNPPPLVSVTDLKGGYLIKLKKSFAFGEFNLIAQKNYGNLLVTVFNEKGIKISLETNSDFFAETVPTDCTTVEFFRYNLNPNLVAVAFTDKKTLLTVYDTKDKIKKIYFGLVDEFCFENEFSTTENFFDIAKHRLRINWNYQDDKIKEQSRTVTCSESFCLEQLPENILPYAFLEEFMLKGNFSPYLDENILNNADKLFGFFGNYIGVMPPPSFRAFNEVGLIYNHRENLYYVDYFSFSLCNRKIFAIKKVD